MGEVRTLNPFSVHGCVVQRDFAAGVLLHRVHHAGVEGPRIQVQAHGTFAELARIANIVDGIQRINGNGIGCR